MASDSSVDCVTNDIDNINISGPEPTARRLWYPNDEEMTRDYIVNNQPWEADELPMQYYPNKTAGWYPPLMCLGLKLNWDEILEFCKAVGVHGPNAEIPREDLFALPWLVAAYLNENLGIKGRLQKSRADCRGPGPHVLYTLVTNYNQSRHEKDLQVLYDKLNETVEKALGKPKDAMWWLELKMNNDPKIRNTWEWF
ncbi:hypothetical protein BDM02DRAFT_3111545 [Thelephora ganbajun]|uniref:Uncharacterized protein n=1 Tax=Thelephora ganbajun TaxID=370292 RepID=A0ACB6ZLY5_THEGA|nr:hypothetical protein BDM02DRAFT_3111545 [Thelephora ganbajun]